MSLPKSLQTFSFLKTIGFLGSIFVLFGYGYLSPAQQSQPARKPLLTALARAGARWAKDFAPVNGTPETWVWKMTSWHSTGKPIGVFRTQQKFTNFELVAEWRHLEFGGNSGIFAWVPDEALKDLPPDKLPNYGIEIQALDHGYETLYEKRTGKKRDFFTTNGDVFAVGKSRMTPFPPLSPNGSRSFPRKNLSKGVNEWNHYYVRAINGEIRLWVNGEEVSGGNNCEPRTGYLCLEAEGSPVEFKNIRIRELP